MKSQRLLVEPDELEIKVLYDRSKKIFHELLTFLREKSDISQRLAAEIINIDRKNISKYEHGQNMNLSTYCDIITNYLLFNNGEPADKDLKLFLNKICDRIENYLIANKNNGIPLNEEFKILLNRFFNIK